MPNENETPTRIEQYLAKTAGEDAELPAAPMTRIEQYLAKIAGEDVELPEETYTRIEQYLKHIAENGGGGGTSGLSEAVKQALLQVIENVAYTTPNGETYYQALYDALYPTAELVSISAVFTQGSAVIYDTDSLDTLKQYLSVTATYADSTTATVSAYTLSGTLAVGTSTITVSYDGKTDTFTVTVTAAPLLPTAYQQVEYIGNQSNAYFVTTIPVSLGCTVRGEAYISAKPSQAINVCGGYSQDRDANISYCCYSGVTTNSFGTFHGTTNCFTSLSDLYSSPLKFTTIYTGSNISITGENRGGTNTNTVSVNAGAVSALNVFRASPLATNPFVGRIYWIEVLNGSTTTAKLIPCYRKADNVVGMYDVVNEKFYSSDNATAFTKGGDVA